MPLKFELYSPALIGRAEYNLEKLQDQKRKRLTLEVRHPTETIRVIGELTVDLAWLHSQTELSKSLLAEYEKELQEVQTLLDKHSSTLVSLQEPFPPLLGFEIAPKVGKVSHLEHEFVQDANNITKGVFKGRFDAQQ